MNINFKTLSEALYADSDYLTKLANQPKMKEYCQEIINATVDINRAAFQIKQQPKTGAWVPIDAEPHDIYECNACGWLLYYEDRTDFKYCPNCGARMTESEDKE